MLDTTAEQAADLAADLVPQLRWCERDSAGPERLLDVLHYVTINDCTELRVSVVEVSHDVFFHAVEGDHLDRGSEILLVGDLVRERRGVRPAYRIDAMDMQWERCRVTLESRTAVARPVFEEGACRVRVIDRGPAYTRKYYRAECSLCGFVGREYGPASLGSAHDEAIDHACTDGAK